MRVILSLFLIHITLSIHAQEPLQIPFSALNFSRFIALQEIPRHDSAAFSRALAQLLPQTTPGDNPNPYTDRSGKCFASAQARDSFAARFPQLDFFDYRSLVIHNSCPDQPNGAISVSPMDNIPGISYLWNTGHRSSRIDQLDEGNYTCHLFFNGKQFKSLSFQLRSVETPGNTPCPTGHSTHQGAGFSLFPNPASDIILLKPDQPSHNPISYTVSDLFGRILLQQSLEFTPPEITLPLPHNWNPGTYFISLYSPNLNLQHTRAFIKQ